MTVRTDKPAAGGMSPPTQLGRRPSHLPPPVYRQGAFEWKFIYLWQDELGFGPIGIDDDFFELDGDSVSALNILLAFEHQTGIKLSPSLLVEHPTIRALAEFARSEGSLDDANGIVTFRDKGSAVPVYFVPGLRGDALNARALALALGDDIPFYGVQNMDVASAAPSDPSIEDMAAKLVSVIRDANPDGPFIMAGYCVGAILAYEIAQQLRGSGADVPLLIMIDAANKSDFGRFARWAARWRAFRRLDGAGATERLRRFARDGVLSVMFRTPALGPVLHRRHKETVDTGYVRGLNARIIDRAYEHYRPRPYGGRIALYTSEEYRSRLATNKLGWAGLARGGLDVIDLPTEHLDMMSFESVGLYDEDLRQRIIAARPAE